MLSAYFPPKPCGREGESAQRAAVPGVTNALLCPVCSDRVAAAGAVASQLKTPPCLSSQGKRKGIPCYSLRIESPLKCLWWYLCAEGHVTTWQSGKPEALHQ